MNNEPISIAGATALVLSSGVALAALFLPGLTDIVQAAIILFGNSVIILGSVVWARARSTSLRSPVIPKGTIVEIVTPAGQPNESTVL